MNNWNLKLKKQTKKTLWHQKRRNTYAQIKQTMYKIYMRENYKTLMKEIKA